jgi:hypothetical protein
VPDALAAVVPTDQAPSTGKENEDLRHEIRERQSALDEMDLQNRRRQDEHEALVAELSNEFAKVAADTMLLQENLETAKKLTLEHQSDLDATRKQASQAEALAASLRAELARAKAAHSSDTDVLQQLQAQLRETQAALQV